MRLSETLSIQLTIGSKTYPIEIDRKKEETYRKAAQLINNKIHKYISFFPDQATEDYMAMTLIDIAVSLIDESNVDDKLHELVKNLDEALHLDKGPE